MEVVYLVLWLGCPVKWYIFKAGRLPGATLNLDSLSNVPQLPKGKETSVLAFLNILFIFLQSTKLVDQLTLLCRYCIKKLDLVPCLARLCLLHFKVSLGLVARLPQSSGRQSADTYLAPSAGRCPSKRSAMDSTPLSFHSLV